MKDKKRKSKNTNAKIFIENKYKQFVDSFKEKVPELSSQWLGGSDELIELVSNKLPVEECVGLWAISLNALRFVTGNDDPFGRWEFKIHKDDCKFIYDWYFLFRVAKEQRYDELEKECKDYGNLMLALGYLSIYFITLFRLYLYLEANPKTRDALYTFYGKTLEGDNKSKPYVDSAVKSLSKYARYNYKQATGDEPDTSGKETDYDKKLYFDIWSEVRKILPDDLISNLILAAKGDKNLKYIPTSVAMNLMNEYKQRDDVRLGKILERYKGREKEFKKRYVIHSIDNPPQIEKSSRIEEVSRIDKWINSIQDHQTRDIAKLKYIYNKTLREIEKILHIPRSTIHDRLKKLKPPS